ncbi:MAG: DNA-processing protein DprA [Proteobacteria bacterium]|nr:DNA-processing protein DprA [Pseudomonadota bacterium]
MALRPPPDELAAWLRLILTPGLGHVGARRLLATFGLPQTLFEAGPAAWRGQVGETVAAALAKPPADLEPVLAASLAWLDAAPDHHVFTLGDAVYPAALLQTADPPLLLFGQGDLSRLANPALAMVGSRAATAQGLDNARAFGAHLSQRGLTIVSGLALGIDGAAHEGGLRGPGGTIAVIGTGPDIVYPRRHAALAARIRAGGGLILSEYTPGTPPLAPNFPKRNRLIAGLGLGTLVVEAAPQSGSLITARLAAEIGREVFAIPGSIHSPQSRGCHALIKQGAKLVETGDDVWQELGHLLAPAPPLAAAPAVTAPAPQCDPLLAALGHDPLDLDVLVARTGWPAHELTARLLELELQGQVARLPGGSYQRRGRG